MIYERIDGLEGCILPMHITVHASTEESARVQPERGTLMQFKSHRVL